MIIVLKKQIEKNEKEHIVDYLSKKGFRIREIQGESDTVLGAVGSAAVDHNEIRVLPGVAEVIPISKPYKLASREFKKTDTVINIGGVKIGGNRFCVMGGPCAVENAEQIDTAARIVAESGGVILRGGAFKPRTSPYAFQGLGEEGLKLMKAAGRKYGLPIATEIVSEKHIPIFRLRRNHRAHKRVVFYFDYRTRYSIFQQSQIGRYPNFVSDFHTLIRFK